MQEKWEEAERIRKKAVADARMEEQHLAKEEALSVARRVTKEKRKAEEQAKNDKERAVEDCIKYMDKLHKEALEEHQKLLEVQFATKLKEVNDEHNTLLTNLKLQLSKQAAENNQLRSELEEMTESRDSWELKYKNIKMEFSDFINQFPGFRDEFILK